MNAPATRLGKYDLVRALGEGAMGVVYEAVDSVIERTVAIKTIRKSELDPDEAAEHGRRFLIEAKAAGKLNHPNIVGLYDHGDEAGLAYIVMELVQGRELQHYFNERYPFTLGDIVRLMGELLDALGYSHRRGVIHRDVKPANIFITDTGHIKLGDFGIARIESSTRTRVGAVLGTPSHMAPEQIRGEGADARSDLYAAGVVLYQFLTGERPFSGTMLTMALKVLNEPAPVPSSVQPAVPPALDAVVARALAKQPADRYQSAADFWRALAEASGLAAGPAPDGLAAGAAADGFGRSGFGESGFGRSGFGDTGFGRSGFGDTGFGETGVGRSRIGSTSTGATAGAAGGMAPSPPPRHDNAAPTLRPRAGDTATPSPAAPAASPLAPRPAAPPAGAGRPRLAPSPAAPEHAAAGTAPRRSRTVAWLGAGALAVALAVAAAWWTLRPSVPTIAPDARRDTPVPGDKRPAAPATATAPVTLPPPGTASAPAQATAPAQAPVPGALPPPAPPAQSTPPVAVNPPPAPAPTAAAAPALDRATSGGTAVAPAAAPKPPPRPVREARVTPPKAAAEPAAAPQPKASRPARCSDILQKASLEPLTSEEAAYLRRECQ